jgi:hypothetical protein
MFCVYRNETATALLRRTWEGAGDALRTTILQAMQQIEQELQDDPHRKGESRPGGARILFQSPLAVLFEVDDEKRLVRIVRAWAYRNGSEGRAA